MLRRLISSLVWRLCRPLLKACMFFPRWLLTLSALKLLLSCFQYVTPKYTLTVRKRLLNRFALYTCFTPLPSSFYQRCSRHKVGWVCVSKIGWEVTGVCSSVSWCVYTGMLMGHKFRKYILVNVCSEQVFSSVVNVNLLNIWLKNDYKWIQIQVLFTPTSIDLWSVII